MHFAIHKERTAYPIEGTIGDIFHWTLEKKDHTVAKSARHFRDEKACRSDIASAKTSMKGAGRCKVLSPGEEA